MNTSPGCMVCIYPTEPLQTDPQLGADDSTKDSAASNIRVQDSEVMEATDEMQSGQEIVFEKMVCVS